MASPTTVRARIDASIKMKASKALADMGLSLSDYIRMALVCVAQEQAIPFSMKVPNDLTKETLEKSARGEDVHAAQNKEELFKKLGL